MTNIILFGPPGAGKGTQSKKLIEKYDMVHLSTGDLFRQNMKIKTELGEKIEDFVNNGLLVPDEITIAVIKEKMDETPHVNGFLFDGFPRTVEQAEKLKIFMDTMHSDIHAVIELMVSEEEIRTRIGKRKDIENRTDDATEKLNKRINEYFKKTINVLPFYKQQNKLHAVQGSGNVDKIFTDISAIIDNL